MRVKNARAPSRKRVRVGRVVKKTKRVARRPVNTAGQAYKKLLVDPCYAPLCPTPYEGGLGGSLQRNVTGSTGTVSSFGMYCTHPVLGSFFTNPATSSEGVSLSSIGVTTTNSAGRAIAGCSTLTWVGSEAQRQGLVSCGVIPGAIVWQLIDSSQGGGNFAKAISVAGAMNLLTSVARVPVDKCEVNWFPADGDEHILPAVSLTPGNTNTLQLLFASVNFTCIIVNSNGPSNSVVIKNVGVIELGTSALFPYGTNSVPWNVAAPTVPGYDWKQVLTALSMADTEWYIDSFKKVAALGAGVVGAYGTMGLPGALGYLVANSGMKVRGRMNNMSG